MSDRRPPGFLVYRQPDLKWVLRGETVESQGRQEAHDAVRHKPADPGQVVTFGDGRSRAAVEPAAS